MSNMAELTQEEKDKAWTNLKFWWKVKKGEEKGDPEKAKKEINKIQKLLGVEITDFDKEEPAKDVKEYTNETAEAFFTEEQIEKMKTNVERAIAIKYLLSGMIVKHMPSLKGNAPGIGQVVNITYDLIKDDLKKMLKEDTK